MPGAAPAGLAVLDPEFELSGSGPANPGNPGPFRCARQHIGRRRHVRIHVGDHSDHHRSCFPAARQLHRRVCDQVWPSRGIVERLGHDDGRGEPVFVVGRKPASLADLEPVDNAIARIHDLELHLLHAPGELEWLLRLGHTGVMRYSVALDDALVGVLEFLRIRLGWSVDSDAQGCGASAVAFGGGFEAFTRQISQPQAGRRS